LVGPDPRSRPRAHRGRRRATTHPHDRARRDRARLGAPWEKPELYVERSAYRKVKDVTTPLLIQSGAADRRVSPEQSIQFYEAMKRIGKAPVKLVLYPGQGHGISDVRLSKDRMLRNVEWFSYWVPVFGQRPVIRMD
jgi:dipeptidyl aminopeptidase/acylaminoacyl peptidase